MRDRNAPGRPREFDETEMLRKIVNLFWKFGYEGVSLSRIMSETGLQKASLYAAFGDKRSMYLKALAQYHGDVVTAASNALQEPSVPALDRLKAFLSSPLIAAEQNDRSGCFLCNASADQADLDSDTKRQVADGFARLLDGLKSALRELDPDFGADRIQAKAGLFLAVYSGSRIMVRSGVPTEQIRLSVEDALRLVH